MVGVVELIATRLLRHVEHDVLEPSQPFFVFFFRHILFFPLFKGVLRFLVSRETNSVLSVIERKSIRWHVLKGHIAIGFLSKDEGVMMETSFLCCCSVVDEVVRVERGQSGCLRLRCWLSRVQLLFFKS